MKADSPTPSKRGGGLAALLTGGLAAILASTCCLGPLLLLMLGVSGAWIGNLTLLEPYRPVLIGVAMLALFIGYRRIGQPAAACAAGRTCARPALGRGYKALFWSVAALLIVALGFPLIAPWFY